MNAVASEWQLKRATGRNRETDRAWTEISVSSDGRHEPLPWVSPSTGQTGHSVHLSCNGPSLPRLLSRLRCACLRRMRMSKASCRCVWKAVRCAVAAFLECGGHVWSWFGPGECRTETRLCQIQLQSLRPDAILSEGPSGPWLARPGCPNHASFQDIHVYNVL